MGNKQKGQSIIEAVFLIGALAVVLSGVVVLMLTTMNSRTKGFDRKKASELAEREIERLVDEKTNNPDNFWSTLTEESGSSEDYQYKITFIDPQPGVTCKSFCKEAVVEITWTRNTDQKMKFSRFFSR
jgi:hypothetical protein